MRYILRSNSSFDRAEILEEIRRKTFTRLRVQAFPRPTKRDGTLLDPRLPSDLTVLNDVQLGRLYSEFACMAQYVQLHIAERAVEYSLAKAEDRHVRARVRLTKSGTNGDKEAKTEMDPRAAKTGLRLFKGEAIHSMTEAVMAAYIIGRDATSREMTRRGLTSRDSFPNR